MRSAIRVGCIDVNFSRAINGSPAAPNLRNWAANYRRARNRLEPAADRDLDLVSLFLSLCCFLPRFTILRNDSNERISMSLCGSTKFESFSVVIRLAAAGRGTPWRVSGDPRGSKHSQVGHKWPQVERTVRRRELLKGRKSEREREREASSVRESQFT